LNVVKRCNLGKNIRTSSRSRFSILRELNQYFQLYYHITLGYEQQP